MNNYKTFFFIVVLALGGVAGASAQSGDDDFSNIKKTLNYYLEGGTNNDFETLQRAFHKGATMKFINDEGYQSVNAVDFFKANIEPGPPQKRKTRIVSINISGNAANAKLEIEYDDFMFIDYMNLLKIDGDWKVVGKIFFKKQTPGVTKDK